MKKFAFIIALFLIGCAQEEVMTTPAIEAVPEQLTVEIPEQEAGPWEITEVAEGVTVTQSSEPEVITEDVAKEIALARVPGRVTDVSKENKFGKLTIVVEIQADNGPETDVIIDMDTGEVLGIET
ncbi:MAG TPA: PepSY domain-containing protein [Candidatus Nanoarchaeia archaeon]|nr:PepSY domain-containing protein [Candidatus Nanoarchaeia archaeon]